MRKPTVAMFLGVVLGAVLVLSPSVHAQLSIAGELFVDLDAADVTAGEPTWTNNGTLSDFVEVGDPVATTVEGIPAVSFNEGLGVGAPPDAYQSQEVAPAGLIGPDPTRSIEVWAYNPDVAAEETLVAWGKRGGPNGTNMAFNYGNHGSFGAVGHWGGDGPDLGWGTNPPAGQWHHLVYTYDGETTRVYADGFETNNEFLGFGAINTFGDTKITVAAQLEPDGVALNAPLVGVLSIARIRVHDEVLEAEDVLNNFLFEAADFGLAAAPTIEGAPTGEDVIASDATTYSRTFKVRGIPIPDVSVFAPTGATLTEEPPGTYTLNYDIPGGTDMFEVNVTAENTAGEFEAVWMVRRLDPGELAIAENLLVSIDATVLAEGPAPDTLVNNGSLTDFTKVGDPEIVSIDGTTGISFGENGGPIDYYEGPLAPAGITGLDPTRSIEVWMQNRNGIAAEETLVAWGHRGGPAGSNMGFHHGTHGDFGAVGHWGAPDIGWGAEVPTANRWHYLVYTYDGETTRVYANGVEANSEVLGAGAINTHADTPILIGAEHNGDVTGVEILASLVIARARVHDGVLTPEQIATNYELEQDDFPTLDAPPSFDLAPGDDFVFGDMLSYTAAVAVSGFPVPDVVLEEPPNGILTQTGEGYFLLDVPLNGGGGPPPPKSFEVRISASNSAGQDEISWTVTFADPPAAGDIKVAGEVFVDLDAGHETAGTASWFNAGTLSDFVVVGEPAVTTHEGAPAVSFNTGFTDDAYQSVEPAPAGLVGTNPTRSIEVWAWNESIDGEETLLAWGHRGGPDGSNMSFNYGSNDAFGAVGHWGFPDIGWGAVPTAGQWHLLTYTYDGFMTRVYSDGVLANSEFLGSGVIDTHAGDLINIAVQNVDAGGTLDFSPREGALSIGRVRVHDEVLSPYQVLNNYLAEKDEFPLPEPPEPEPLPEGPVHRYSFTDDASDSVGGAHGTPLGAVSFGGGEALLPNDPVVGSNDNGQSPPADPPGAYIDLPNGIISALGTAATFEVWATWNGPTESSWQRYFDFGTSVSGEDWSDGAPEQAYVYLTPRSGSDTLRFCYRSGVDFTERQADYLRALVGVEQHIVVTWDEGTDGGPARVALYVDGLRVDSDTPHISLAELIDVNNWLGRSQWPDAMYNGSYNEFRIYDYALTPNQVLGNFEAGPDTVTGDGGGPKYVRGDTNADGGINIADPVFLLNNLFGGGPPCPCREGCDCNDDGGINIADPVYQLNNLFGGGPPIPPPNACGETPDSPDVFPCDAFPPCGTA